MRRIGRSVFYEDLNTRDIRLPFFLRLIKKYYEWRIKRINRKVVEYGSGMSYKKMLWYAAKSRQNVYFYKKEALALKHEEKAFMKRIRNENRG